MLLTKCLLHLALGNEHESYGCPDVKRRVHFRGVYKNNLFILCNFILYAHSNSQQIQMYNKMGILNMHELYT